MRKVKLIANSRQVARRAWSVRLAVLSAVLGAAEVGVNVLTSIRPSGALAAMASIVALAAAVARLIQQHGIDHGHQ